MTDEELEIEYSPSLHSKRFKSTDELLENFVRVGKEGTDEARDSVESHLNISYGPGSRQNLDIYGVHLPKNSRVFVFVHGGFFQVKCLTKNNSAHMAKILVDEGIKVIVVDHDLCPDVTLQEIVNQIQKCFVWIADYVAENEIKKLVVCGHSAGAYLIFYGLSEEFYAKISQDVEVNTFYISGIFYMDEIRILKSKSDLSLNDGNYRALSPLYSDFNCLKSYRVKNFIFAAENDSDTFKEHSKRFHKVMQEFDSKLEILPGLDHFDIIENLASKDYVLIKLIIMLLEK